MPIYHFNVQDGVSVPDEAGHELPDLAEAKRYAVVYAADLIREFDDHFWHGHEWRLDVTDEAGRALFSLTFLGTETAAAATA